MPLVATPRLQFSHCTVTSSLNETRDGGQSGVFLTFNSIELQMFLRIRPEVSRPQPFPLHFRSLDSAATAVHFRRSVIRIVVRRRYRKWRSESREVGHYACAMFTPTGNPDRITRRRRLILVQKVPTQSHGTVPSRIIFDEVHKIFVRREREKPAHYSYVNQYGSRGEIGVSSGWVTSTQNGKQRARWKLGGTPKLLSDDTACRQRRDQGFRAGGGDKATFSGKKSFTVL